MVEQTAALFGVVTFNKERVSGAIVTVYPSRGADPAGRAMTDAMGRYRIDRLKRDRPYLIGIAVDGGEQEVGSVRLSQAENVFDISLPLGGSPMPTDTITTSTTTSATTTTDTATTGTTTTDTTTTGTTTGPTTGTTTTGTTTSTTTSATTATSATTVTVPPMADFDLLLTDLRQPEFAPVPQVTIGDAVEFRRLYTVAQYVLAGVPNSMEALQRVLSSNPTLPAGFALVGKDALTAKFEGPFEGQKVLDYRNAFVEPDKNNQAWLLEQARRQFDLGTAAPSPTGNNTEFKAQLREFVGQCADDLMGVDPETVKPGAKVVVVDARQYEAVLNFLKRVKRSIITLTQSMSFYGTSGTHSRVAEWAKQIRKALNILKEVGTTHIASDDPDDKHFMAVLNALNIVFARATNSEPMPRSQLKAHVVHALDGGDMLDHAIAMYTRIQADTALDKEDADYLRTLFYQPAYVFQKPPAAVSDVAAIVLKNRAAVVRENWPPNWT